MARQVGDIKITGTFDDLSFYKSEGDYFVRMKGGPSKKQIASSPEFARVRENNSEFGACSQAGAFLRGSLKNVLPICDPDTYRRVTQLMSRIKNYDNCSPRGKRTVGEGLKHPEAKQLLCDFVFNSKNPLSAVLLKKPVITAERHLVLSTHALALPAGAAYATAGGALLNLDFEAKTAQRFLYTEERVFTGRQALALKIHLPEGGQQKNMPLYFLSLRFYAEDGTSWQQGALDSSGFIAADPEPDPCPALHKPISPVLKGETLVIWVKRRPWKRRAVQEKAVLPIWSEAPV